MRLTPRGGRDAIEGTERRADGRAVLKVRVRAVPAAGEANAALCLTIARALAIAPRQVTLAGGATSRLKRIRVAGDPAVLIAALRRLVSETGGDGRRTTDRNAHIPSSVLRARSVRFSYSSRRRPCRARACRIFPMSGRPPCRPGRGRTRRRCRSPTAPTRSATSIRSAPGRGARR